MYSTPHTSKQEVSKAPHRKEQSSFMHSKKTEHVKVNALPLPEINRNAKRKLFTQTKSVKRNINTGSELVYKAMEQQAEAELQIELIKEDLALCSRATVRGVWLVFDPAGRGYVTLKEVKDVLELFKLDASDSAVKSLFARFDKNMSGVWEYDSITDMIVPIEKDYRDVLYLKGKEEMLSKEALMILKHLIKVYVESETGNEISEGMAREVFDKLDITNKQFLTLFDVT
eukprot:TRINITY_DN4252_c0_g2_i1.p1 TRINITY_DN4252_c0_g2~~TRINITY_DN4252_c0_g2_i1.p1  ORF type:complete len:229 (+),score=30.84 TRINITY_DN4252_c0_g2_i1:1-687(+)